MAFRSELGCLGGKPGREELLGRRRISFAPVVRQYLAQGAERPGIGWGILGGVPVLAFRAFGIPLPGEGRPQVVMRNAHLRPPLEGLSENGHRFPDVIVLFGLTELYESQLR